MTTFLQKVLFSLAVFLAVGVTSAHAEDESYTVASGYLFTDFDYMASDQIVANRSSNFQMPLQLNGNLWAQTGLDSEWTEVDLTASTPQVHVGSVEFGAMGGIYYLPAQDADTILTLQVSARTNVAGFGLRALSQWYWEDLEDQRFQLSASRSFAVGEGSFDVEIGHSWLASGAEPNFVVVGTPVTLWGQNLRVFAKHSWGVSEDHPPVIGVTWNR